MIDCDIFGFEIVTIALADFFNIKRLIAFFVWERTSDGMYRVEWIACFHLNARSLSRDYVENCPLIPARSAFHVYAFTCMSHEMHFVYRIMNTYKTMIASSTCDARSAFHVHVMMVNHVDKAKLRFFSSGLHTLT